MVISSMRSVSGAYSRSSHGRCSVKKGALKNVTGKQLCWSLVLIKLQASLLKRDSTRAFSSEICETFNNTYIEEHLRTLLLLFRTLSNIQDGVFCENSTTVNYFRKKLLLKCMTYKTQYIYVRFIY